MTPVLDDLGRQAVFVVAEIGPKRAITPEGFLFLEEVPICRTGDQLYAPREVPVPAGPQGYVVVSRQEADVFRPEFIRSFEGKPFLLNHPPERLVTIDTWKRYARGHLINPRRGEGDLRDFLICDVLVTDPEVIKLINDDVLREVSAGYTAEYEELEPKGSGRARQYDMIGNHLALVKSARCGPRCSIQDTAEEIETVRHITVDEASITPESVRKPFLDRIVAAVRDAFKAKGITVDEATVLTQVKQVLDEMPIMMPGGTSGADTDKGVGIHIHGSTRDEEAHTAIAEMRGEGKKTLDFLKRMADKLGYKEDEQEGATKDDDEEERKKKEALAAATKDTAETAKRLEEETGATGDAARAANDSALLSGAHQEAAAGAEILVPGITITKFDATAKPKATLDSICGMRRSALELASKTNDGRAILERLSGGKLPNFVTMDCATERVLFRAAVQAKKSANDAATAARSTAAQRAAAERDKTKPAVIRTNADFNKRASEFWKEQSGGRK